MFERFVETARRAVFFSRFEASALHSAYIETEHMLLGLLREDPLLKETVPAPVREEMRRQLVEVPPRVPLHSTTSVDLPLSSEVKRAFAHAAEESRLLGHSQMHCGHLILGLLHMEDCEAVVVLNRSGIRLEGYREIVKGNLLTQATQSRSGLESLQAQAPRSLARRALRAPKAPSLSEAVKMLHELLGAAERLRSWPEQEVEENVDRAHRKRNHFLAHLVDWTCAHHTWFAVALTQDHLRAPGYPPQAQEDAQDYGEADWADLLSAWESLNRLIFHVVLQIGEEKLTAECKIGADEGISLLALITNYCHYSTQVMQQIKAAE